MKFLSICFLIALNLQYKVISTSTSETNIFESADFKLDDLNGEYYKVVNNAGTEESTEESISLLINLRERIKSISRNNSRLFRSRNNLRNGEEPADEMYIGILRCDSGKSEKFVVVECQANGVCTINNRINNPECFGNENTFNLVFNVVDEQPFIKINYNNDTYHTFRPKLDENDFSSNYNYMKILQNIKNNEISNVVFSPFNFKKMIALVRARSDDIEKPEFSNVFGLKPWLSSNRLAGDYLMICIEDTCEGYENLPEKYGFDVLNNGHYRESVFEPEPWILPEGITYNAALESSRTLFYNEITENLTFNAFYTESLQFKSIYATYYRLRLRSYMKGNINENSPIIIFPKDNNNVLFHVIVKVNNMENAISIWPDVKEFINNNINSKDFNTDEMDVLIPTFEVESSIDLSEKALNRRGKRTVTGRQNGFVNNETPQFFQSINIMTSIGDRMYEYKLSEKNEILFNNDFVYGLLDVSVGDYLYIAYIGEAEEAAPVQSD